MNIHPATQIARRLMPRSTPPQALRHPLALTRADKVQFAARGVLRERVGLPGIGALQRRELARRAAYQTQPVVRAYNRRYANFRKRAGRNPSPVEREAMQMEAAREVEGGKKLMVDGKTATPERHLSVQSTTNNQSSTNK